MEEGKEQHLFVKVKKLMEIELEDTIHEKAHSLVESVFPDSKLPFNIDHTLLDKVADVFNNLQHPLLETDVAEWMNNVGTALSAFTGQPLTWT